MKSERVILEDWLNAVHFTKLSSERHQHVKEEGKRNVWFCFTFSFIAAFGASMARNGSLRLQMQPTVYAGRKTERCKMAFMAFSLAFLSQRLDK